MTEQNQIRQTENPSAGPQGHTGSARCGAEREERNDQKPLISWAALLDEAVSKPGFIHQAYSRFHNFSIGNQMLALFQCLDRQIPIGPLASFTKWKQLGRHVKRGARALTLCMPVTCNRKRTVKKDDGTEQEEEFAFTHFVLRPHCLPWARPKARSIKCRLFPNGTCRRRSRL
jgi:hypothetical protein